MNGRVGLDFGWGIERRGAVVVSGCMMASVSRLLVGIPLPVQIISAGDKFIRLVDGKEMAQPTIRRGVGVITEFSHEIKKRDGDYFVDDV